MSESVIAESMQPVMPDVFRWEAYSPGHKVNLTSHAVISGGRIFVFDPIQLAEPALLRLVELGQPAAIILTNGNHERACEWWREQWHVPIWAARGAEATVGGARCFEPEQADWNGWRIHSLAGGGAGEAAFRWAEKSLMIFGDAVVNLPGRGLELLPTKYCSHAGQLREHLRTLIREPFEAMIMAHGEPVLSGASAKLAALL